MSDDWFIRAMTDAVGAPCRMDGPDGPTCGCGNPSGVESGLCFECVNALRPSCPECATIGHHYAETVVVGHLAPGQFRCLAGHFFKPTPPLVIVEKA